MNRQTLPAPAGWNKTVDLQIRPTKLTDSMVQELRAATGKDASFAADVLGGRVKFLECVDDALIVGHCIGNAATGEIIALSVEPSYRRKGVARKLLAQVVDLLRDDNARRIWLAAPRDSTLPAYGVYRAMGWQPTGEHPTDREEILEHPSSRAAAK
jgi:ribosomal protein S18 acetylase RimI-like enzyme